jgi:hypothetical protein
LELKDIDPLCFWPGRDKRARILAGGVGDTCFGGPYDIHYLCARVPTRKPTPSNDVNHQTRVSFPSLLDFLVLHKRFPWAAAACCFAGDADAPVELC